MLVEDLKGLCMCLLVHIEQRVVGEAAMGKRDGTYRIWPLDEFFVDQNPKLWRKIQELNGSGKALIWSKWKCSSLWGYARR